ncbi:hypothetical protein BpHYR1_015373 [Brachionus plicatilis]|uniref:Uncharacterized protein n=1 Tax=Brachionus plicatilis TaxID=10195 RepID=A0A3M7PFS0_BRAPC|nr:hypothetical protein BpHYR1_015373 [Brachionus plicatilis]
MSVRYFKIKKKSEKKIRSKYISITTVSFTKPSYETSEVEFILNSSNKGATKHVMSNNVNFFVFKKYYNLYFDLLILILNFNLPIPLIFILNYIFRARIIESLVYFIFRDCEFFQFDRFYSEKTKTINYKYLIVKRQFRSYPLPFSIFSHDN